ncbi:MAG: hypothetical protein KGS72_26330 [Cyanobacteria bacterium REEB67]|nr:hypothetical protein [Cyanobacteria bacterium REEB67]
MTNQHIASNSNATDGFFLPVRRINAGLTLQALSAIGVEVLDDKPTELGYQRCKLPNWTAETAPESSMQTRLIDDQGRLRAKIFYKPGSQGAGASMEIANRYKVVIVTDERFQWAEVRDGNEVIYMTNGTRRSDRNLDAYGFNAELQPEHVEASAWLAANFPEHKNPLAYWN